MPETDSNLAGRLLTKDGEPVAELTRNGEWKPCSEKWAPVAELLGVSFDPARNNEAGDHHTPPGSALLERAGKAYGYQVRHLQPPYPSLPPGVVS